MNNEEWMNKARVTISEIGPGKSFVVKDLFEGYEWNFLTAGERRNFSKHFKNCVQNSQVPGVTYVDKKSNNSAYYIKA